MIFELKTLSLDAVPRALAAYEELRRDRNSAERHSTNP